MKNRLLLLALACAILAGCGTSPGATFPTTETHPTVPVVTTSPAMGGENAVSSEKIQAALSEVYAAKLIYPPALEMTEGVSQILQIALTRDTGEQAIEELKQQLETESALGTQDLKIRPLMDIALQSDSTIFRIKEQTPRVQGIGPGQAATWTWLVTPLRADGGVEQELKIIAIALAQVENGERIPSSLPTRAIKIRVKVNPAYSMSVAIQTYWWTPVAVLLLALLWRSTILIRRRSKRADPANDDLVALARHESGAQGDLTDLPALIPAIKLRQILVSHFNESELRDLCFDLGIDYEVLGGDDKADKARELILYFGRVERTTELVDAIRRLRPQISL